MVKVENAGSMTVFQHLDLMEESVQESSEVDSLFVVVECTSTISLANFMIAGKLGNELFLCSLSDNQSGHLDFQKPLDAMAE